MITKNNSTFEWDEHKNLLNKIKHGISFYEAQYAFSDKRRIIKEDQKHIGSEQRYYCIGKIKIWSRFLEKRKNNL